MDDSEQQCAGATVDADTDELFELLGDEHRRYVLAALDAAARPLHLADLATQLARAESGDADVAERRQQLSLHLYHADLPKLADAGLVAFDRDERTVALTDDGASLAARTEILPDVTEDLEPDPSGFDGSGSTDSGADDSGTADSGSDDSGSNADGSNTSGSDATG